MRKNIYVFACDMEYAPDEHYYRVFEADSLKGAIGLFTQVYNTDTEQEEETTAIEVEAEVITECIEYLGGGKYNMYTHQTYVNNQGWEHHKDLRLKETVLNN